LLALAVSCSRGARGNRQRRRGGPCSGKAVVPKRSQPETARSTGGERRRWAAAGSAKLTKVRF